MGFFALTFKIDRIQKIRHINIVILKTMVGKGSMFAMKKTIAWTSLLLITDLAGM